MMRLREVGEAFANPGARRVEHGVSHGARQGDFGGGMRDVAHGHEVVRTYVVGQRVRVGELDQDDFAARGAEPFFEKRYDVFDGGHVVARGIDVGGRVVGGDTRPVRGFSRIVEQDDDRIDAAKFLGEGVAGGGAGAVADET